MVLVVFGGPVSAASVGKVMRLRFLGVGNTAVPKERTEREVNPKPDPKPYTRNPKPY